MREPKLIVVLAHQRSGTNHLRGILSGTLNHHDMDEAFAPDATSHPPRFLRYLTEKKLTWPDPYAFGQQEALYIGYLDWLVDNLTPNLLFDVKYSALNMGLPFGFTAADPSRLLTAFDARGAVFVHLVRPNSFQLALSCLLANATGIYHRTTEAPGPADLPPPIHIEPGDIEDLIEEHQALVRLTRYALRRLSNAVEISYEDIDRPTPNMEALGPVLLKRFGYKRTVWEPSRHRKVTPNWRDRVSNAVDIERHFQGTSHASWIV